MAKILHILHFLDKKCNISIQIATHVFLGIDSRYDLVPKRRQAITRSDVDPVHWRIYVLQGLNVAR